MLSAAEGCLMLWALAIAVTDLRRRKIPNLLTLPACIVGLAWMGLSGHCLLGDSWSSGLLAGAFGLAVTLPAYAVRKLGAGDAKYLLAIGVLSGWEVTRVTFVVAAASGLALALAWWAWQRTPGLQWLMRPFVPVIKAFSQGAGKSPDQLYMPFGTLLSIGFCAALLTR